MMRNKKRKGLAFLLLAIMLLPPICFYPAMALAKSSYGVFGGSSFFHEQHNDESSYSGTLLPMAMASDSSQLAGGVRSVVTRGSNDGAGAVAIRNDGSLWTWGLHSTSPFIQNWVPTQILPGVAWESASVGHGHIAAIQVDGSLWAWGDNNWGALGDGTTVSRNEPNRVNASGNWSSVSAGWFNTAAIMSDGSLWVWGSNLSYNLGLGRNDYWPIQPDPSYVSIPTNLKPGTTWKTVAALNGYMLAISTDGSLWGWGTVGTGPNSALLGMEPAQIGAYTNWSGFEGVFVMRTDGSFWMLDNDEMVMFDLGINWTSVALGGSAVTSHNLAIRQDGSLWAWGANTFGQLGIGTTIGQSEPVRVGEDTDWTSVAIGSSFSVATRSDGSVWTWGRNEVGQLGAHNYPAWRQQRDTLGPAIIPISQLTVPTGANIQLYVGESAPLTAIVTPSGITNRDAVVWSSDSTHIASIEALSGGGIYTSTVYAHSPGIATILVATYCGNHAEEITISVEEMAYFPRASAPTTNVVQGLVPHGKEIHLQTSTPNATIRFTLDGSEPDENSAVFSDASPIVITNFTRVRARVFANNMTPSRIADFHFDVFPTVATPTASIPSGYIIYGTRVTFSSATPNAIIHLTQGSFPPPQPPTQNSWGMRSPITLPIYSPTTVKVMASGSSGWDASEIAVFEYRIRVATPMGEVFLANPNTPVMYGASFRLRLPPLPPSAANRRRTIHYTTNGEVPTINSPVYSELIRLTHSMTIRAKAVTPGYTGTIWDWADSEIAEYDIKVHAHPPSSWPHSGAVAYGTTVRLDNHIFMDGTVIRFTTDGSEPTANSQIYSSPIRVDNSMTIKARAFRAGLEPSPVAVFEFDVTDRALIPVPTIADSVMMYYRELKFESATPGAEVFFTIDGSFPDENSMSGLIPLYRFIDQTVTVRARAFAPDLLPSDTAFRFIRVISPDTPTSTPAFLLPPGSIATSYGRSLNLNQEGGNRVRFARSGQGVMIWWTNDGTDPEVGQNIIPGRRGVIAVDGYIEVNFPQTIRAIAVSPGRAPSPVVEFTYSISEFRQRELDFGNISKRIPQDIPIVGDREINLNLNRIPGIEIHDEHGIMIAIGSGFNFSPTNPRGDFHKIGKEIGRIGELADPRTWNAGQMRGVVSARHPVGAFFANIRPEVYIMGYLEGGIFPFSDAPPMLSGRFFLKIGARSVTDYQFFLGPVPVVLILDVAVSATGILDISLVDNRIIPEIALSFVMPELTVMGGVGIAWVLSVGAYGQLSMHLDWDLSGRTDPATRWRLKGAWGAYARVLGFLHRTRPFRDGTIWCSWCGFASCESSGRAVPFEMAMFYINNYTEVAPRNHLGAQSPWLGNRSVGARMTTRMTNSSLTPLQLHVFEQTAPLIAEANTHRVMIFLADDGSRSDLNNTTLVYSIYYAGGWSEPKPIMYDGTADFFPNIVSDGDEIWVTWHNSSRVFIYGIDLLPDIIAASEIAAARFDGQLGTFVDHHIISTKTDNPIMNSKPVIAVNDGEVVVAWVRNSQKDIFGTEGLYNSIIARKFTNGEWGSEIIIADGLGAILDMDISYFAEGFHIAYIIDRDNDLYTVDDRDLIVANLAGVMIKTPAVDTLVSRPRFAEINGEQALSWFESGNIRFMVDGSQPISMLAENDMATDAFRVLSNLSGETAIIYATFVEGAGYIMARLQNEDGRWGNSFRLYQTGDFARFFCGVWDDSGEFHIVLNNSRMSIVGDGDSAILLETNNLYSLQVAPLPNLRLAYVLYHPEDLRRGDDFSITIGVENIGGVTINDASINIISTNNELVGSMSFDGGLGAKEIISIEVDIPIYANMEAQTEFVITIEPLGVIDADMRDNSHTILLGLTNLALQLESRHESDGLVSVSAHVHNTTDFPAYAMLIVRRDSADGDVIWIADFGDNDRIEGRSYKEYTFEFYYGNVISIDKDSVVLFFEVVSGTRELFMADNSAFIVIHAPREATLPQLAYVTSQENGLGVGVTGIATFTLLTQSIGTLAEVMLNNIDDISGISLITTRTAPHGNVTVIEINVTDETPRGAHPLSLTVDGITSYEFLLLIGIDEGNLISGTVHSNHARKGVYITVNLYHIGSEDDIYMVDSMSIQPGGFEGAQFTFRDVSPGIYRIRISKPGHLVFTIDNIAIEGSDIYLADFTSNISLIPGSITGGDTIGAADIAELLGLWGTSDPRGALSGGDVVGAEDIAVLLGNWGVTAE